MTDYISAFQEPNNNPPSKATPPVYDLYNWQVIRAGGGESLFSGIRMVQVDGIPNSGRLFDRAGVEITGVGGGFDPTANQTITGDWTFNGDVDIQNTNTNIVAQNDIDITSSTGNTTVTGQINAFLIGGNVVDLKTNVPVVGTSYLQAGNNVITTDVPNYESFMVDNSFATKKYIDDANNFHQVEARNVNYQMDFLAPGNLPIIWVNASFLKATFGTQVTEAGPITTAAIAAPAQRLKVDWHLDYTVTVAPAVRVITVVILVGATEQLNQMQANLPPIGESTNVSGSFICQDLVSFANPLQFQLKSNGACTLVVDNFQATYTVLPPGTVFSP